MTIDEIDGVAQVESECRKIETLSYGGEKIEGMKKVMREGGIGFSQGEEVSERNYIGQEEEEQ